ncbi:protein wings apart-like isoform X5 [Euwallacea fornicatus]|uniref:protein wings apart-like isoform X5 n=1 Tax=Euwallacea fornicatus TaxID=995702 RepID=UPI00338FADBA
MSRGFGKYKRGASHHSFHFDTLFKENSNRPSAARSAASVGKWGITSFTSIRTLNGRQEAESKGAESAPKPKKFFKSRDISQDANSTSSYQATSSFGSTSKRSCGTFDSSDRQTRGRSSPKKFFSSKNAHEKMLTLNQQTKRRNSDRSDTSESSKPPIVLRICKGKSQLINDDDPEKTDTPSTASTSPTRSPRALRENSNSQPQTTPPRPSNCRITRSARRSMQMDPSTSPAAADTPSELTVFPAAKKDGTQSDLSPQYVPAEKFEEERRALYASLLKPDSPYPPGDDVDSGLREGSLLVPDGEPGESAPESSNGAPSGDRMGTNKSIEDVMAELHGGVEQTENIRQDLPSNVADLKLKLEASGSAPQNQEFSQLSDQDSEMEIDKFASSEPPQVEESVEEKLARLEAEYEQPLNEEPLETIENIAKEIQNTKVAKVVPPVRKRGRQKDVKKDVSDAPEDEKVPRHLRVGLRTRNRTGNTAKDWVDEEEEEDFEEPVKKKPKVKEKNTKLAVPPIKIKTPPMGITEEPLSKKDGKKTIEEEWGTDSDSNSTVPELEMKQPVPSVEPPFIEVETVKEKISDKTLEKPPEPLPVKLVISKKKGSIFKSRALVDDDSKKRRAIYVHKWTDKEGGETPARPEIQNTELDEAFDFKGNTLTRVTSSVDDAQDITSVKCAKTDKPYYMVVRNVKKAHQIQEIGEFQEFNDDVEYILDALQDNNPISTRCLSAITLASKCMAPAFRMHVRAHGTVAKFFKALHDATKDQSLGLCTATVMFVLSQDRLNMDLDRDCLELMLNLLESDVSYQQALDECGLTTSQLEKNKQKVRELCAEIQSQGHAMHLNLENITTGQLAMETLLSLTSKRAGEWFKEELRELGGLEHIMKTIHECCRQVSDYVVSWTDVLLDKLKKVDRCLRVLENVTQNNEENQTYILKYNDGMMIDTLFNLYKLCDCEIPLYPVTDIADKSSTGTIIREALMVTLKVLINLTHHFRQQSIGSQLIGSRAGIIETSLHLLLQVPNYIPEQKKFELGVLVLMLLINLIQDQEVNKKLLMEAKAPSKLESIYSREESAVEALIVQYYEWESCAKIAENKTNAILDGEKDEHDQDVQTPQQKSNEEFIEETVAKLLQKAGTHMEYTFLASYIVMVVGFLIMDNEPYQVGIRQFLRGNNFTDMVELLKKFFNFMNLTASTEASSVCAIKATQKVIKFLESCDETKTDYQQEHKETEPVDLVVPYL